MVHKLQYAEFKTLKFIWPIYTHRGVGKEKQEIILKFKICGKEFQCFYLSTHKEVWLTTLAAVGTHYDPKVNNTFPK